MVKKNRENEREEDEYLVEIKLDDVRFDEFRKRMKCGIYKQLYERKMLTASQLNDLLNHM